MEKHCHSCGGPLAAGVTSTYCQYCVDASGKLKAYDEIKAGIAEWLSSWSPKEGVDFARRADAYMKAMPAWANR
jgi:hypothetical protein